MRDASFPLDHTGPRFGDMELEPFFDKVEAQTCKRDKESWDDHEVDTGKILVSKLFIPSFISGATPTACQRVMESLTGDNYRSEDDESPLCNLAGDARQIFDHESQAHRHYTHVCGIWEHGYEFEHRHDVRLW